MRLDGNAGDMIRGIYYIPGFVLWGCNFRGAYASDRVSRLLRENGAVARRSEISMIDTIRVPGR